MDFDLTDLRLFLCVVEAGSITVGARRAHLALASASVRIRNMEERSGTKLLHRDRRGVRVTSAGDVLLLHARAILAQVDRMSGELSAFAHGLKGQVRLLANTAATAEFLPGVLSDFLIAHPQVDIDLEERLSQDIVQAVTRGQADIGIVSDGVGFGGLETFPFRRDRLVVVVAQGEPLARRRSVRFIDLLEREFVGLSTGSALQEYLVEHANRVGCRLKLRVRLRSFDAICRLVERGVGIGIVPETAARRCRRVMALRRLRLDEPWALRHLTICVRHQADLPVPARQLLEHLQRVESGRRPK